MNQSFNSFRIFPAVSSSPRSPGDQFVQVIHEEREQIRIDAHNVDRERIPQVELGVLLNGKPELGHLPLHVGANVGAIVVPVQRTENDTAIFDPADVYESSEGIRTETMKTS